MVIQEKIGAAIRELRQSKGLSQDAFSAISGIDRGFLSHIEQGHRNISLETLEAILVALDVSFHDFFSLSIFDETDIERA